MEDQRFMGHILSYDPEKDVLVFKVDFLDLEKQEIIESIAKEKDLISFCFRKPFRRSKTYDQLKYYFLLMKHILIGLNIVPQSDIMKAFDIEHKKRCFPAQNMDVGDQIIPLVKSKADMSVDEMKYLTEELKETYREILIDQGIEL